MSVCLSLRLSHASSLSKRLHIYSNFLHHGVAYHSSFSVPNGMAILLRGPPNVGCRMQGSMKNHDFRPIYRFISEIMQDRAIVTMEGE